MFIIGSLPPFLSRATRTEAANNRTWQLIEPLIEAGHSCVLFARAFEAEAALPHSIRNLEIATFNPRHRTWLRQLHSQYQEFQPDAIVGVTFRGGMYATRIHRPAPLWIDLYGDLAVETQGYLYAKRTDIGWWTSSWIEQLLLSRGDVFSACSERQKHALIGKLGLLRRLNRATFCYEFVHAIPPAATLANPIAADDRRADNNARRIPAGESQSIVLPNDAVVVLWTGSYNTWTDLETLFQGLALAMSRDPRIHYVSSGGAVNIPGFADFQAKIDASPFRERFHLLGWVPYEQVQALYRIGDIGLSIDATHYEVLLGTRTRLIEMALSGLALTSTPGTELVEDLERAGALRTFPAGSAAGLANVLIELSTQPELRTQLAARGREVASTKYSPQRAAAPLLKWVEAPHYAPDKAGQTPGLQSINWLRLKTRQFLWRTRGQLR